jgi:hypothetical protein
MSAPTAPIGDASLFFGVAVGANELILLLLRTDAAFAAAVLAHVRKSEREFAKYRLEDVIDDVEVERASRHPRSHRHREYRPDHTPCDMQCADAVLDMPFDGHFARCVVADLDADKGTRNIPITAWPGMDIEFVNGDDAAVALVGLRIPVYTPGGVPLGRALPGKELSQLAVDTQSLVGFVNPVDAAGRD